MEDKEILEETELEASEDEDQAPETEDEAEGVEEPTELDRLMGFAPSESDTEKRETVEEDMRRYAVPSEGTPEPPMEPPMEPAAPDAPPLAPQTREPDVTGGGEEAGGQAVPALTPELPPATDMESEIVMHERRPGRPMGIEFKPTKPRHGMKGFRSLLIDVDQASAAAAGTVTFESLGVDPKLVVTLANRPRLDALGWVLALAVALLGLVITNRPAMLKIRLILAVFLVGTLVPLVPGWESLAVPANMAVYAAACLVPYYLVAGLVKWIVGLFRRVRRRER